VDLPEFTAVQSRRRFLRDTACGLGAVALADLLAQEALAAEDPWRQRRLTSLQSEKRHLSVYGRSPSQLDLFEPKPALTKHHGEPIPESMRSSLVDTFKQNARLMASRRTFQQYGQSGIPFSDLLPNTGKCADDLCMIHSLHTDITNHHPAQLIMNCGTSMFGRPSMAPG